MEKQGKGILHKCEFEPIGSPWVNDDPSWGRGESLVFYL